MPIYEITKDKLEEILEDCVKGEKIKPTEVELVKEIAETIDKLDKIIERKNNGGEYGNYGRDRRRDSRGRYMDGNMNRQSQYPNGWRDGYGDGHGGVYGHDKNDLIAGIEEKMAYVSGEEQDTLRHAVRILERG